MLGIALVAALLAHSVAHPVAQPAARDTTPARLSITIADSTGHRVAGALVRVDSTDWRAATDSGTITVTGITPGRHLLEARAIGYAVSAFHVRLDPGDAASVGMTLHRPAAATTLSDVVVNASRDTVKPPAVTTHDWTEGFARRKQLNIGGIFLDQAQIERRGAYKMTQLLANLPGVEIREVRNQFGEYNPYIVMRGTSTIDGKNCPISYFLDGHPYDMSQDETVDQMILPHDVQAIEVYPGASQVPAQFKTSTSARCGVIVVWSRSAAR